MRDFGYNLGAMPGTRRPRRSHFTVSRAAHHTWQALENLAGEARTGTQPWVFVDVGVAPGGRLFATPQAAQAAQRRERAARAEQAPMPRRVLMRLAKAPDGRLVCTGLVLGAFDDEEIGARYYRRLPLIELLDEAGRWAAGQPGLARQVFGSELPQHLGPRARPGPKGHPDEHFEQVAELYRRALVERPRAPMQGLLDLVNEGRVAAEQVSEATVRRWLQRARDKGFLGDSTPGKAGEQRLTRRRRQTR